MRADHRRRLVREAHGMSFYVAFARVEDITASIAKPNQKAETKIAKADLGFFAVSRRD